MLHVLWSKHKNKTKCFYGKLCDTKPVCITSPCKGKAISLVISLINLRWLVPLVQFLKKIMKWSSLYFVQKINYHIFYFKRLKK